MAINNRKPGGATYPQNNIIEKTYFKIVVCHTLTIVSIFFNKFRGNKVEQTKKKYLFSTKKYIRPIGNCLYDWLGVVCNCKSAK